MPGAAGLPPDALAAQFASFGEEGRLNGSSLYERLALAVASDSDLLALAAHARNRPVPNLFFAAVHYLILKGTAHPLAALYRAAAEGTRADDPYPCFRSFCREHADAICSLLATRLVQTSVVRRCAYLVPAFALVAARAGGRPLALVDVGASAGLNLLWDRYGYDYGGGRHCGNPASPVHITCKLRGERFPPLPKVLPAVAFRTGIDLAPIDVRDPDAALWLRALVWPDHADNAALLDAAISVARHDPPPVRTGDALDILPEVLAMAPDEAALCVYHNHTLNQFSPEARDRFAALIDKHAAARDIYRLAAESLSTLEVTLELTVSAAGARTSELLARCHAHGRWIEWLAG